MASDTGPNELCTSIYIGNLDHSVTEDYITTIFSKLGPIRRCKLIQGQDSGVDPYCFVEYHDHGTAEAAIITMNGRQVLQKCIRVNWATNAGLRKDTSNDYHIFVGDLSYEIDSNALQKEFEKFGEVTDVRVVRDAVSGKSKGYGFISFKEEMDASNAIKVMHGKLLNGRAIRTNWAARKGPYSGKESQSSKRANYDEVSAQASPFNCTIYVGGLPEMTEYQLHPYFQPYGTVINARIFADKGYAFVTFSTHDEATQAIYQMNGAVIEGNSVKQHQQQYYQYYQQYQQSPQQQPQMQQPQYSYSNFSYQYQGYPKYNSQPTIYMQGQGGAASTTLQGSMAASQLPMSQTISYTYLRSGNEANQ